MSSLPYPLSDYVILDILQSDLFPNTNQNKAKEVTTNPLTSAQLRKLLSWRFSTHEIREI